MIDVGAFADIGEGWISVFGRVMMLEGFEHGICVVRSPVG